MTVRISVLLFACALACGRIAASQAIGQGVMLNQQSMQNAGNARIQPQQAVKPESGQTSDPNTSPAAYAPTTQQHSFGDPGRSLSPFLSEDSGYVTPGTKLVISSPIPGTIIHYTTDGWTPTEDSLVYVEPITIDSDMRVQAIAFEPGMLPSPIADATFIVKPRQPLKPQSVQIPDDVLRKDMALRLITGIDARSDTAQVGDTLLLKLDVNVMHGDTVLAAKGSLGKATITAVERAGRGGKPGLISFKVESLDVHGIRVPLQANLTLAAPDIAAQTARISNPNSVRVVGILPKGDEAVIEPGMLLTAIVGKDTPLR